MITLRKSQERGHANHGWLDTHHTFSFASYYDPAHMQFRSLRVLNEDRVTGGEGLGRHPHQDMEILSYIVSGALEHRDSMGHRAVMKAGDVQRISAGTGIYHSEYNHSPVEPVHFLQVWLVPDRLGVTPSYAEKSFDGVGPGKLHLIASTDGRDGSLSINQDADVFLARLGGPTQLTHRFSTGRFGWVQSIAGDLIIGDRALRPGDGAAIEREDQIELTSDREAHFLLFDLN